jgi:hypothetical protein
MKEKFYRDDFELSLQEQADEFKMPPSKNVWQSIYNDLHPGRRWPSIMMSVILLSVLLIISFYHTDSKQSNAVAANTSVNKIPASNVKADDVINKTSRISSDGKQPKIVSNAAMNKVKVSARGPSAEKEITYLNQDNPGSSLVSSGQPLNSLKENIPDVRDEKLIVTEQVAPNLFTKTTQPNATALKVNKEIAGIQEMIPLPETLETGMISEKAISLTNLDDLVVPVEGETLQPMPNQIENLMLPVGDITGITQKVKQHDELAITDHAQLKAVRKRFSKISWAYYAAPFVSTVAFKGEHLRANQNTNAFTSLPQVVQKDMSVQKSAALGFEAGVQMRYALTKKIKVTSGLHFTRTGYNITSNIVHPTLSSLVLKNPETGQKYTRSFVTHYGDGTGSSTILLNNYNYQASVPVGLQFTLFNNNNLQFNLAADIEPSYVLDGDAYVLSSDGRNYISVPDLLRKWNFSSNFAPYVSFKANKFNWNIGPNIRYQWLSTFQNSYTHKQHLLNYGIRVGISK